MLIERRDGSLLMLLRNTEGIAQSVSTDGGTKLRSAGSPYWEGRTYRSNRFFIRG